MTLILGAAYTLWLVKRVVFGPVASPRVAALEDLNPREFLVLGALALAVLLRRGVAGAAAAGSCNRLSTTWCSQAVATKL